MVPTKEDIEKFIDLFYKANYDIKGIMDEEGTVPLDKCREFQINYILNNWNND